MTVHLRGPETRATRLPCPPDAEFFGADLRLGAYVPAFPPDSLANLADAELPVLSCGRILLDGRAWEMPTAENLDVFVARLERAGLLRFDPLIEELRHGTVRGLPERTAQSRFLRAVGVSRRAMGAIERARAAAGLIRDGRPITEVAHLTGYYDQPHLARAIRRFIGYTPAQLADCREFLDL